MNHNPVGWFEIPVHDMSRAVRFYEEVFEVKLTVQELGPLKMAMFQHDNSIGIGGALIEMKQHYTPSADGVLIYFTAFSGDLSVELQRVEKAGGKILQPKKQISPDIGWMGLFLDSEGNRIALHHR